MDDDCIQLALTFVDANELLQCMVVNKLFQSIGQDERLWERLCAVLWEGKQNHPLERWVKLPIPAEESLDEMFDDCEWEGLHRRRDQLLELLESRQPRPPNQLSHQTTFVESSLQAVHEEDDMQSLTDSVRNVDRNSPVSTLPSNGSFTSVSQSVSPEEELVDPIVASEQTSALTQQQSNILPFLAGRGESLTTNGDPQGDLSRRAIDLQTPHPQWVSFDEEYLAIEAEFAFVHRRIQHMSRARQANELENARDDPFLREAAPLSRAVMQQALRAEAQLVQARAARAQQAFADEATSLEEIVKLEEQAALALQADADWIQEKCWDPAWCQLTWRESFFASLKDSQRNRPLYCELRELGDWLILFGESLEMCRFVEAGYGFIDDHAFRNRIGRVHLTSKYMVFTDIRERASISRDPHDWGWLIDCDNGFVCLASFDKAVGPHEYSGSVRKSADGMLRDISPLSSQLKDYPHLRAVPLCPMLSSTAGTTGSSQKQSLTHDLQR